MEEKQFQKYERVAFYVKLQALDEEIKSCEYNLQSAAKIIAQHEDQIQKIKTQNQTKCTETTTMISKTQNLKQQIQQEQTDKAIIVEKINNATYKIEKAQKKITNQNQLGFWSYMGLGGAQTPEQIKQAAVKKRKALMQQIQSQEVDQTAAINALAPKLL